MVLDNTPNHHHHHHWQFVGSGQLDESNPRFIKIPSPAVDA